MKSLKNALKITVLTLALPAVLSPLIFAANNKVTLKVEKIKEPTLKQQIHNGLLTMYRRPF